MNDKYICIVPWKLHLVFLFWCWPWVWSLTLEAVNSSSVIVKKLTASAQPPHNRQLLWRKIKAVLCLWSSKECLKEAPVQEVQAALKQSVRRAFKGTLRTMTKPLSTKSHQRPNHQGDLKDCAKEGSPSSVQESGARNSGEWHFLNISIKLLIHYYIHTTLQISVVICNSSTSGTVILELLLHSKSDVVFEGSE